MVKECGAWGRRFESCQRKGGWCSGGCWLMADLPLKKLFSYFPIFCFFIFNFAECPIKNTRQRLFCRPKFRRVLFVECGLGKDFVKCIWTVVECKRHSAKRLSPIVIEQVSWEATGTVVAPVQQLSDWWSFSKEIVTNWRLMPMHAAELAIAMAPLFAGFVDTVALSFVFDKYYLIID